MRKQEVACKDSEDFEKKIVKIFINGTDLVSVNRVFEKSLIKKT